MYLPSRTTGYWTISGVCATPELSTIEMGVLTPFPRIVRMITCLPFCDVVILSCVVERNASFTMTAKSIFCVLESKNARRTKSVLTVVLSLIAVAIGRACISRFASAILLLIWPKLIIFNPAAAAVLNEPAGANELEAAGTAGLAGDGPWTWLLSSPITRSRVVLTTGADAFTGGIISVTTR